MGMPFGMRMDIVYYWETEMGMGMGGTGNKNLLNPSADA